MSTSILYHGFGIRDYRYVRTEFQQCTIIFTVEKDRSELRCPVCQGHIFQWGRTTPTHYKLGLNCHKICIFKA